MEVGPGGRHHEEDGPVPEIHAVRDPAQIGQRAGGEHPGHHVPGRLGHDGDHRGTAERDDQEAAVEREGRGLRDHATHHDDAQRAGHADHREGTPAEGCPDRPPPLAEGRQRAPDQQPLGAGVAPVVGPGDRGRADRGQGGHQEGGGDGAHCGDHGDRDQLGAPPVCSGESAAEVGSRATAAHRPENGKQDERPHEVELLLDGEGPGVLER